MGYWEEKEAQVSDLIGKTLTEIKNGGNVIEFVTTDGERYLMYHQQDCCESVAVDDIVGDLGDLIGTPIVTAREDTNKDDRPEGREYLDSFTWTFYNLATSKGYVQIKWFGESNGYYSESVDFRKAA